MSLFNLFTQGGQTQLHQLRMIRQVVWATLIAALFVGVIAFGVKVMSFNTSRDLYRVYSYYLAELKLEMPYVQKTLVTQDYITPDGQTQTVHSLNVLKSRDVIGLVRKFIYSLAQGLKVGLYSVIVSLILMSSLWIWRGRKNKQRKLLAGVTVVTPAALKRLLKKEGKVSSFTLAKVSLVKDEETKHMLISGTTGSGKTNCIHELLPQIRRKGQRAIIVDLTGDFVAKYFREGKDTLLNPLDSRSVSWDIWEECTLPFHFEELASSLVPHASQEQDSTWVNASRALLSSGIQILKEQGTPSLPLLLKNLTKMSIQDLEKFFKDTEIGALINKESSKTVTSIRLSLTVAIRSLKYLNNKAEPFSIRSWITKDTSDDWLFLTAQPDQREALRPLLSSWFNIAITSLMSLTADDSRRVWFIVDELPALNRVPSLTTALAEGRKYGGCVVLGLQDIAQLEKTYGAHDAKTILGLLNTKVIFRSPDDQTARKLSNIMGEQESSEIIEGLSFGAHHMRDGVSLSDQRRIKPAVSSTELMRLKNLEAYIRLPGHYPLTKTLFRYHKREILNPGFILNEQHIKSLMLEEDRQNLQEEDKGEDTNQ